MSHCGLHRSDGLTLVELLAAITIGAIVLAAGLGVYTGFMRQTFATTIDQRLQSEAGNALHFISDKLHHAVSVQIVNGGSTSSTLQMQEYDGSVATVSFDVTTKTLGYAVNGKSGTLARDVTLADWHTAQSNPHIVQLHLLLEDKGYLKVPVTQELTTEIYTRLP